MRLLTLSLLLSAVLAFRTGATSISFGHPIDNLSNPVIACPGDTVLMTDFFPCGANYTYTVTASDDQPNWTLAQTQGLASGAFFPVGTTVNSFLVTDSDGNSAECSFYCYCSR